MRFSRESSHAHPVALGVEGRGVGRERSAIQRSASRSAPKLMQKALSSWRPRHSPHRERGERRHIAREGQAGGAAHRESESGWKGGDVSFAVVTGETLCSRCSAQSIGLESFSSGNVDDPRPVALTWGGAGVDHTPYPIPQAPHTRLGHYSPIANSKNSFLKACTEEFFWSEIFWNLPWIGCVRCGVWGMG